MNFQLKLEGGEAMEQDNNKKVISVSISPTLYNIIKYKYKNISNFVEQAIVFYLGYLEAKNMDFKWKFVEIKGVREIEFLLLLFNEKKDFEIINKILLWLKDNKDKLNKSDKREIGCLFMTYTSNFAEKIKKMSIGILNENVYSWIYF